MGTVVIEHGPPLRSGGLRPKPQEAETGDSQDDPADIQGGDDDDGAMAQARVDNAVGRTFRSFLSPDLLILDDLGLHRLTAQQSADLYELIIGRHRVSSFIITIIRSVEEWLSLFDDPILGNSALDRPANASFQAVIEGTS